MPARDTRFVWISRESPPSEQKAINDIAFAEAARAPRARALKKNGVIMFFDIAPEDQDRVRKIIDAIRRGGSCAGCGRKLIDGEPVWRTRVKIGRDMFGGYRKQVAPLCQNCLDPDRAVWSTGSCGGCGRKVNESEPRWNASHHYCCEPCRDKHQSSSAAAAARQRRADARGPSRQCAVCGEHFEAARADARTARHDASKSVIALRLMKTSYVRRFRYP